jgi:hypothetical protein
VSEPASRSDWWWDDGAHDEWEERQAGLGCEYEASRDYGDPLADRERPGDEEER